jgi:dihydrofolate synthase/folylpolyglutamate synthase
MSSDELYQDALNYIYGFIDNSLTHQANLSLADSDLSKMFELMKSLGNPQDQFPSIHVAGSKGKGSVSAFCASALNRQGYKVGLYTSPHLRDFEERIQINRVPISRKDFVNYVEEIKPYVSAIPGLNTFEIITALAFLFFYKQSVDIAVIEVGLGGRLDATNVITPKVSVITALYLEHTRILGDTIEQIAREKAGIIKQGIPVVISPQEKAAQKTIENIAAQRNAHLYIIGRDYRYDSIKSSLNGQSFTLNSSTTNVQTEIQIRLLGQHQVENASTAYVTLQHLREQGIPISEMAILEGFGKTDWPGRFEILRKEPPLIIDSAHNLESARKLRMTIDEYFPGRPVVLIFGVSDDKNVLGMINELLPGTIHIFCSQSTHPRAMDAEKLLKQILPITGSASAINDIRTALEKAIILAGKNAVVLVTGSIFVAATARIAWLENMDNFKTQ